MSVRPKITSRDLGRLLAEAVLRHDGDDFDAWVESESFEIEALVAATKFITSTWRKAGEPEEVLALFAFAAGWDAHRDLRGERDQ